ncbi:MAG: GSCFA family protein [Brevundimonas sp.]|nr:MAG: GSCFA family protein [Brevundimonas sp.]
MSHPYASLPDRAYWRTGVAQYNPLELQDLYRKRFDISPTDRVACAGSCFAQHIGRQLRRRGFNYLDMEKAPPALSDDRHLSFGYGMYSARFGNIYTARQMLQLYKQAFGLFTPATGVWKQADRRYFDPLRPSIEPNGFGSAREVQALRETQHLPAVKRMFQKANVLVFTLGLTEAWMDAADGTVYPVCPGTVAGEFDAEKHVFKNFRFGEILADMTELIEALKVVNPTLRILLTVSPVPLTATAAGHHVLAATTYSKSVLRAVAGELYETYDHVDYFPSYEIVTAPSNRGMFFRPNMREVAPAGVDYVMTHFFGQHPAPETAGAAPAPVKARKEAADVACDEEKLELVRA